MEIQNKFISSGCNTCYKAVTWHKKFNLIAYASSNHVNIYDPEKNKIALTLNGHSSRVNSVKFYASEQNISLISGASDGSLIIWKCYGSPFNHESWKIENSAKLDESVSNIAIYEISEKCSYVMTLTTSTIVQLWKFDGNNLQEVDKLHFGTTYQEACELTMIDETNLIMFLGGIDKLVHIYSLDVKKENSKMEYILSVKGHENAITDLSVTKAEHNEQKYFLLASASRDTYIRLWKISEYNKEIDNFKAFQNKNNHKVVLSTSKILNFSLDSVLSGHTDQITSLVWGLNDTTKGYVESNLSLLSTSFDFSCYIWKNDKKDDIWINRARLGQLGGNKNAFFGGVFNGDYKKIITYTFTGAFYLWSIEENDQYKLLPTITGHYGSVTDLDWSSEGDYLVSCSTDQTTRIYCSWKKNDTWSEVSRAQIHGYDMNAVKNLKVKSRDGKNFVDYIISGGDEKVLRMFEASPNFMNTLNSLSENNLHLFFEKPEDEEKYLAKSDNPNEVKYVVSAEGSTKVLGLMNIAVPLQKMEITYGKEEEEDGGEDDIDDVKDNISYDYKTPPFEDFLVKHTLWPEVNKFYGHGHEIKSIASNSQGTIIASACKSQNQEHSIIILWDPKTYMIIDRIVFHNFTIVQLEFSQDDQFLLTGSRDRQIGLFKLTEDSSHPYKLYWSDKSHSRIVWSVAFSHDSNYFASGARDKVVKLWKVGEKPECIKTLGLDEPVLSVAFGDKSFENGKYVLVVGLESGKIIVHEFDSISNELSMVTDIAQHLRPSLAISKIKFKKSSDAKKMTFAVCSEDYSVRIFDLLKK